MESHNIYSAAWIILVCTVSPMLFGDPASLVYITLSPTRKIECHIEKCSQSVAASSINIQDMLVDITFSKDIEMLLVQRYMQTGHVRPVTNWEITGNSGNSYTVGNLTKTRDKSNILVEFCVKTKSLPTFNCSFYLTTPRGNDSASIYTSSLEDSVITRTESSDNPQLTSSEIAIRTDQTKTFIYNNTVINTKHSQDDITRIKRSMILPTAASESRSTINTNMFSTPYSTFVQADVNTIETSISSYASFDSVQTISSSAIHSFFKSAMSSVVHDLEPSESISHGTAGDIMYSTTNPCTAESPSIFGLTCRYICPSSSTDLPVEDLESVVKHLKEEMKINKAKLSSNIRRRISAVDNRPISVHMGTVGAIVIGTIVILIIASDCVKLFRYIHKNY